MSDKSSDETVSYSEEEVVDFEMDVDPEPTDVAMATILEESEELEKKSENNNMGNGSQSSGKGLLHHHSLHHVMYPSKRSWTHVVGQTKIPSGCTIRKNLQMEIQLVRRC